MAVDPNAVRPEMLNFNALILIGTDNDFDSGFGFEDRFNGSRHDKHTGRKNPVLLCE